MKYVGENAFKKWTSLVKSDIKKKLDKNQGTANSGKILGVDASGEVAPTDTEVATLVDVPNGIVKGDGSTLSAAVAGTDYVTPDGMNSAVAEAKPFIVTFTYNGDYHADKTFAEIKAAYDAGKMCYANFLGNICLRGVFSNSYVTFIAFNVRGSSESIAASMGFIRIYSDNSIVANAIRNQPFVTASGLLKGNGNGGVSAATAGTDYMVPPTGGTAGQVLTKTANSSEWADAPKSLPEGGTAGDALVKSTDGGSWETPVEASLVEIMTKSEVEAAIAASSAKITASTTDLTAGTSPLATGELYVVYE